MAPRALGQGRRVRRPHVLTPEPVSRRQPGLRLQTWPLDHWPKWDFILGLSLPIPISLAHPCPWTFPTSSPTPTILSSDTSGLARAGIERIYASVTSSFKGKAEVVILHQGFVLTNRPSLSCKASVGRRDRGLWTRRKPHHRPVLLMPEPTQLPGFLHG